MTRYLVNDSNLRKEDSIIDILSDNRINFDLIEDTLIIFDENNEEVENLLKEINVSFEKLEGEVKIYQFEDSESFEIALETLYMLSVDYNYSPDNYLVEIPLDNIFAIENCLANAKINYISKI